MTSVYVDLFRHDLGSEEVTLCGIDVESEEGQNALVACGCNHPSCEFPITCPVCLAVKQNKPAN